MFHIVKRDKISFWQGLLIRVCAVAIAIVICLLFAFFFVNVTPIDVMKSFFKGNFGSARNIFILLKNLSILLLIALALTPAFRMRFWNIGGEGQVLVGALASVSCAYYLGGKIPEPLLLVLMLAASLLAGAVWGFLPALFKAIWNANETLFTLMMNYVATCLISFMLAAQFASNTNQLSELPHGHFNLFPFIRQFGDEITVIAIAALITVLMFIYLNYSKQGYEISVVGESENTARYIGINVKKVVIRTMILSGALCGLVGFLIAAVFDHSVTINSAGGLGFTAIMVSWLGKFNPFIMVAMSAIVSVLTTGAGRLVDDLSSRGIGTIEQASISPDFPKVIVGIILFFIVGCEFFIHYQIKFKSSQGGKDRG
ncbi:MAG: ABC transporter permease [Clostridia bacterium]|nr:ABC transporter permease [Clostridia bacterium]